MIDFLWALAKILIINYILFQSFNKHLNRFLLNDLPTRNWTIAYATVAMLLPIFSKLFNQSETFAFFLALNFIILLSGYSANFKDSELHHEKVETLQLKTRKYAIVASIIGYLSYVEFHKNA